MTLRAIFVYRWIVFLLAAGYVLRTLIFGDYSGFGGPFRYLTVWALGASFFSASRMMAIEEERSENRWDGFVSMTAVINTMTVFLYWRLFFADPSSVTQDGSLSAWHLELYMHGLGPLLQLIDALFIHRSFRRLGFAIAWLIGVIGAYALWVEFLVAPNTDAPVGAVTSGLPYPFLNNLEGSERAVFYGANLVMALALLAIFAGISWIIRRQFQPLAMPEVQTDNQDKVA